MMPPGFHAAMRRTAMQKSECRGGAAGGGIHSGGGIILRSNMPGGEDLLQGILSSATGHFESRGHSYKTSLSDV